MDIIISNSNGKPIYEQISSQVRAQILSGALEAGERLPSIRALADGLGVSFATRASCSYWCGHGHMPVSKRSYGAPGGSKRISGVSALGLEAV